MDSFGSLDNFWDISQHPSSFPTLAEDDFLALLQKQFPTSNLFELNPADGIDPINISSLPLPLPNPTPPSTDSSPSPPSVNQEPTLSPRQSGVFSSGAHRSLEEDSSLKRKASSESIDDEPMHKNAHTDAATKKPASGPARRKSTGDPRQDETRLMKRKEQNRAAQRAFRERKEKHVKDLEDKVAALEAKNQQAESENGNLRDLLSRLQSENMALKQAAFTFSVPKPNGLAPSAFQHQQVPAFYPTPGASTSTGASASIPQSQPSFGVDFASLIPFDPASLNQLDEPADTPMNLDYPTNGMSPYKTIASNPMYMSFAEPTPYDLSPPPFMQGQSPSSDPQSTQMDTTHLTPFSWSSPASVGSPPSADLDSLDHLFGGLNGAQSPVDFSALLRSSPSSVSPVSHTGLRPNSASSSASPASSHSLSASSPLSNPSSSTSYQSPLANGECPRTREECVKAIAQAGASPFVQEPNPAPRQPQLPVSSFTPLASATGENCGRMTTEALMAQINNQAEDSVGPNGGFVRKMSDGNGSVVMCKGSSFPKTEKNERNVEVLAAWRSIMQNPQFKNVDINELCSEFTKKARCDGTKVVLEPESVSDIIETLAVKRS